MITLADFLELVKQMRYNQRRFARTKDSHVHKTMKELEAKVDEIISQNGINQLNIF